MTNYGLHEYGLLILLYLSGLAQLVPALFCYKIARITGWVKYWSAGWVIMTITMFWIMVRRLIVALTFDPGCSVSLAWIFDQIISTIITSGGFAAVALLKFKFYQYWMAASVTRIEEKKKGISDDRMKKERANIKEEKQAVDDSERDARDRGPG